MKKYIEYSANIYEIYLKYFSKEDIHVYSIDESFIDVTNYLKLYRMTPIELAKIIIVMFMSLVLYKLQLKGKREINKPWKLVIFFLFWGIPIFLIYKQPDLRNSVILCYCYVIYAFCFWT